MRLYFDLNLGRLLPKPGYNSRVSGVDFKRGDAAQIRLGFYRGVDQVLLDGSPQLSFALKESGRYDSDPLVGSSTWTMGSEADKDYVCRPDFNTVELNSLLNSGDADEDNDLESAQLMMEVTWSEDGGASWSSTETIRATIYNDVIKGNEGVPTEGVPTYPTAGSLYNLTDNITVTSPINLDTYPAGESLVNLTDNITVTSPVDLDTLGAGHVIQEEGAAVEVRSNLNFTGAAVSITDDLENDSTVVTVDGGFEVYSSDTAPSQPEAGDIWFNTSVGAAYIYYVDEDSSQWVGVSPAGPVGPAGPQGPAGVDGVDGVNGVDGANGADGANGVDGADGVNGTDGVDGAGVEVVGSVVDSSALDPQYSGDIGDMFIAQDTGNGHVWDGVEWDDVGTIRGPVGPIGLTGPQGPAGLDGTNGVDGTDGTNGVDGTNGTNGIDGTNGVDGTDGTDGGFAYSLNGTVLTITNDTSAVYTLSGTELTITT